MFRPPLMLAYHGLANVAAEFDPHNLMLDPEQFRQQVRGLQRRDYEFVTVSEFVQRLDGRPSPPPRVCALTFDDGTTDHADLLPGLLEELGVCATIYACSGLLGVPSPFVSPEAGIRLLDAEQLTSIARQSPIEIGSHTRRHVSLATASEDEAYEEMLASKLELEDLVGTEVRTFAYPECVYSRACPRAAARAGYIAAVTCGPRGAGTLNQPRLQVIHRVDNRLTYELKSRALWQPLSRSAVGRLVRRSARPFRRVPD